MADTSAPARAAVPAYLGSDFRDAAPGHRFYLYLPAWGPDWGKVKSGIHDIQALARLNPADRERTRALVARQDAMATTVRAGSIGSGGDGMFNLPARSTAPFATGLGMEHPLENGFAFLAPYGLPYLPGSSIKGVLRQAARETTGGGPAWNEADIDALFGSAAVDADEEDTSGRKRGALSFWDVYPMLPGEANLSWDVMTPHQRSYYQDDTGKTPPHDNDAPVPINFLTVPPGTSFRFHVQCNLALLSHTGASLLEGDRWKAVLEALFAQAFDWLGFGAKTSLGYGAMEIDDRVLAAERQARERADAEEQNLRRRREMPAGERIAEELLEARTNPSEPDYRFLLGCLESQAVPPEHKSSFIQAVLSRLEIRREQVKALKDKKVRAKKLEQLQQDEKRIQDLLEGQG